MFQNLAMSKLKLPVILTGFTLLFASGCSAIQRKFLFFPTHHNRTNGLTPWKEGDDLVGFSRPVPAPESVWLMLHGNGGQAADRTYALPRFSARDAVFIMEYPGYGARAGKPSKASFDAAAEEAYAALRRRFPGLRIGVVGESIGSGPASALARQATTPDKIVLVVPFDDLARVAARHAKFLPVRTILGGTWNNMQSLSAYRGRIEIFAATADTIIPVDHAEALAASLPSASYQEIAGGHNEWAASNRVAIRFP